MLLLSLVGVSSAAAAAAPNPKSMVLRAADVHLVQAGLTSNNGTPDATDNDQPGWISTWRVYWASHHGITHLDDWAETYTSATTAEGWLTDKKKLYKPLRYWHPFSTGGMIGDAAFAYTTTIPSPIIVQTCVTVYWRYRLAVGNVVGCGKPNTFAPDAVVRLARMQQAHMQVALG